MKHISRWAVLSLTLLSAVLLVTRPVAALEIKTEKTVIIPKDTTIDGSLFTAGSSITVDGNVNGDIFCAGQTVTINGDVDGDILCAAQSLNVNGHVTGNVRVAVQSLDLVGSVDRNVSLLGQKISVGPQSMVNGEMFLAGQQAVLEGTVQKDMFGAVESMDLRGHMGKDVKLNVDTLSVHNGASVAGNLTYTSANKALLQEGAVAGTVQQEIPKKPIRRERSTEERTFGWVIGKIMTVLSFSLLGLLFAYLWPKHVKTIYKDMTAAVGKNILYGAIAMFMTPLLAVLVGITVVGLPLAFIMMLLWISLLIVSRVFVGFVVGEYILRQYVTKHKENVWIITLVGMTAITLAFELPFVGWLLSLVSFWWGSGAVLRMLKPASTSK